MITHVAIRLNGKVWSLPKPNRHHHIRHQIYLWYGEEQEESSEEGFLDHDGNFLDRTEALKHITECNQPRTAHPIWAEELCSENLW